MLDRKTIGVGPLIVKEDLVEEVLVKDFVLGGEELSL